ncbi:MAG: D-Ala-D-Ala carboxypeptidase family metallohydrolase, partial [Candidatus Cryptobacteroides sp.]
EGSISENFEWSEFQHSSKAEELGIDNSIPDESIASQVRSLVVTVLQPLRTALGKPLHINSGYRCPALNKALKGAKNSQHTKGQAADVASDNPFDLAELVLQKKLPFDQMILYNTFVHISHNQPGLQRGMVLYDEGYEGERIVNAAKGQK